MDWLGAPPIDQVDHDHHDERADRRVAVGGVEWRDAKDDKAPSSVATITASIETRPSWDQ